MKQIEVSILGHSYILGCPHDGETDLREAVKLVDLEMSAIRNSGKVKSRERIAVLAALNLAFQRAEDARALAKRQVFMNTTTSPSSDEPSNENMAQLIHRIDLILSQPC